MFHRPLAVFVGIFLAAPLGAQTTHAVGLSGTAFLPANLTVQVGDTVQWTWNSGFHDVTSGSNGVANNIFSSGVPTLPPSVFSVTFDQAFLDANPVPQNRYEYFCSVHQGIGMEGSVTVECAAELLPYGGSTNPVGSLQSTGLPTLGGTFTLLIDNPVGSQPTGSFAFLGISNAPDPNFPAGTLLPGFGMQGAFGELLISVAPPNPIQLLSAGPWLGVPVPVNITIPNDAALMCRHFFAQGVMFNGSGFGARFGLTRAVEVVLGN
ncbi:MAG: plastocyanin/azurin family copper-binding protein [Planctomycetota bacterium]